MAVNAGAVASPFTSVIAVLTPPANVPLAPELGAVKVTVIPATPSLHPRHPSVTVADKAVPNAVFTAVNCGEPADAARLTPCS